MTTASTTAHAQIATFLNVAPNAIKSVTEMAWVFCVVVRGQRARFVSKKVIKVEVEMYQVESTNEGIMIFPALNNGERLWASNDNDVADTLNWAKAQGYSFQNWTFGNADKFCPELKPLESQSALILY